MSSAIDDVMKRQYLDVVQKNWIETGRRVARAMAMLAVAMTLLVGLSVGGMEFEGKWTVQGATLVVGHTFPLAVCSIVVSLLHTHLLMLDRYRSGLRGVVLRLYSELRFSDPDLAVNGYPIESPNLFVGPRDQATWGQIGWWHDRSFTALFVIGPVAGQVVCVALLSTRVAPWWMTVAAASFALLSLRDCIAFGRRFGSA